MTDTAKLAVVSLDLPQIQCECDSDPEATKAAIDYLGREVSEAFNDPQVCTKAVMVDLMSALMVTASIYGDGSVIDACVAAVAPLRAGHMAGAVKGTA